MLLRLVLLWLVLPLLRLVIIVVGVLVLLLLCVYRAWVDPDLLLLVSSWPLAVADGLLGRSLRVASSLLPCGCLARRRRWLVHALGKRAVASILRNVVHKPPPALLVVLVVGVSADAAALRSVRRVVGGVWGRGLAWLGVQMLVLPLCRLLLQQQLLLLDRVVEGRVCGLEADGLEVGELEGGVLLGGERSGSCLLLLLQERARRPAIQLLVLHLESNYQATGRSH